MPRYAARVDINQASIVEALREVGASVELLHRVGGGCPDLMVGFQGVNHLMEVKDGSKPPSKRRLNADQLRWHSEWCGREPVVVNDACEALATLTQSSESGGG